MSRHAVQILGWILLAGGLVPSLYGILSAFWRVMRQYSNAMAGVWGLRLVAAGSAAAKRWPFLVAAVVGAVLLLLNR